MANSGCLRNCPWQTYHDNLISHSREALSLRAAEGFNPHLCWTMYEERQHLAEILKATWIRPEDLAEYTPYVDFVKLATRQHGRMAMVVDAYSTASYKGNLLDLLEPGFAPAFARHGIALDNRLFPQEWAERVGHCNRECVECGYCDRIFETITNQ